VKKLYLLLFAIIMLIGCREPADAPVMINRGSGVESVSSMTVVILSVTRSNDLTAGTTVQRSLVTWLKANPDVTIQHMSVIDANGPSEIVLVVGGPITPTASKQCQKCKDCKHE